MRFGLLGASGRACAASWGCITVFLARTLSDHHAMNFLVIRSKLWTRTKLPLTPRSHCVTLSPLTSRLVMLRLIALIDVGDLWDERVIWVGVGQQGADGEEHLGDGEGGRPLVFEDVEADRSIAVDVHVINFRRERDLGRLEGVVGWEVDVQEEHALMVRGVLGAHDRSLPMELVRFVSGAGRAVCRRVSSEDDEFLLDSFIGHRIVF